MAQTNKLICISIDRQELDCFENDQLQVTYIVSTAKNGAGEKVNSQCTPRGWHKIHSILGQENKLNSVFISRVWTGEIYTDELASQYPDRDWILTRILRLEGLESGRNKGSDVDTLARFIYIHGTPDSNQLGIPDSHGCIRMNNKEIIKLASWVTVDTLVYIN